MTADGSPVLPRHLLANPLLSQWVAVRDDGTVEVRVGKVELGQGILTVLAQVVADELDLPLDRVRMLPANTALGPDQDLTAGSMSVIDTAPVLRVVGAHLRALLVAAAAARWGVTAGLVTIEDGALVGPSGRLAYGDLAGDLDLDVPAGRVDAPPVARRLVGTSSARIDLPDKVAGVPRFIADLRLPGQLVGRVVRPPSPGAELLDAGESAVAGSDCLVVVDGSFLGVVGADELAVARAADRLRATATWKERADLPDEDDLGAFLRAGPHEDVVVLAEEPAPDAGDVRRLRASYSRPFLAHASIAPSCGVARWEDDGALSVWSHSQGVHRLRDAIALALDLDAARVEVEHVQNAGCYGHNAADDAAFDAVLLARAVPGRPVMVRWSRRDELAWGPFGPAMTADVAAEVDGTGRIRGWTYDVWGQGHTARPGYSGVPGLLAAAHLEHPLDHPGAADPPLAAGGGTARNAVPAYDVGPRRVTAHRVLASPVRSSALRALGAHLNVFAIESFVDELARLAGRDPLAYRLDHLSDPRGRAVLEVAAGAAGWGRHLEDGVGLGIGFARYKGTGAYCAVVAEVEAESAVRVRRLTVAVDVGLVLNPDGVRNQIEGGAVQATSWTLKERVRFDRTRVTSDDWESYPVLRFSEVPPVEVVLVDRPDLPSVGAGEAAQGPTAAALANALDAALGVRVRDLPLTAEAVVAAIDAQDA
ncbi:molybdopterin cofactor-binding domain-containing protein [Nocardioides panacis]|uniref:molybdopterin cofactor-binding domain-containing protein n=1 Tax=Nocardioides panacis TaxID=2849501 RepID=UPI0020B3D643|nr:molybdopterin cofactor-binding domain-containing protein [Nocardioides panacis]